MSSSSSSTSSTSSSSALSERAPLLPKTPDSSGSGTQGKEGEGGEAAAEAAAGPTRTVGAIKLMMMFPETRWRCFLGLGISILTGSMFPAMSIIFGSLFNSFYTMGYDEINESIDFWAIAFACLAVTAFLMMFTQVSTFGTISEIVSNNLRVQLFNSILDKDVAFFDRHTSGDLTSRLQTDMTAIQAGVSEKVGTLSQNLAQFVLGITVALFYGWQMTLVLLSVVPLLIIAMAIVHTNMQKSQRGASDDFAAANTVATETLAAFRTVLSFGRSDYERERYRDALEITLQGGLRRGILNGLGLGITFFLIFGTYALGFWYGGKLVSEGTMDPGDELTVFFSVVMGAMGLGQGASQMTDIIKAGVSAGVVFDLIEEPELIIKNLDTRPFTQLQGRLDVNNVSFRYPARPDNPVLNGVSFTVYPGQTVALVGSSGSGKSSILQLLLRFYDPIEGSIAIDGHDIRNVNLHSYRENIGLVSQEPILFSGTIMDNIRYGSLNASDNDIFQAAMQANAHNFITSLPEGYNTAVGEKGTQLSGGQKQRVAIARAILKNPSILLLDEATSALDAESERLVQDALNKLMVNRTTIIVAHRLSTIQNADRICYLSGGQILESGTHQELLDLKGGYYQLIRRQTWTAEEFSEAVHDEDVPAP